MPLYRHRCTECEVETLDLQPLDAVRPRHCGARMERLMPRRVVGRVAPDSNGAHLGSGFASLAPAGARGHVEDARSCKVGEILASGSAPVTSIKPTLVDTENPLAIPWRTKPDAKDYTELDAGERDSRWRDTVERMTNWQANCLEQDGIDRGEALSRASQQQQRVAEQSRADNCRMDGLA